MKNKKFEQIRNLRCHNKLFQSFEKVLDGTKTVFYKKLFFVIKFAKD